MRILDCSAAGNLAPLQAERAGLLAAVLAGKLLVVPTDTVYGIGTNPFDPEAVEGVLEAKRRTREFPPPILVAGPGAISDLGDKHAGQEQAQALALAQAFWPGPLTIIITARPDLGWDLGQTNGTVALRQPDHPVTQALLEMTGPLAVTSANFHTEAPATTIAQAQAYFGEQVAYYLDGGPSRSGQPSTIVSLVGGEVKIIRPGSVSREEIEAVLRA